MQPQIVIPDPRAAETEGYSDLYQIWKQEKEANEEHLTPKNIRFVHNPEWRRNLWSLECARAETHIVWKIVSWLFFIAQFTWVSAFVHSYR